MFHVLSKSILSCAISGHFSFLADGLAFYSGQSAVQIQNSTRELAICVPQPKSPADGPAFAADSPP